MNVEDKIFKKKSDTITLAIYLLIKDVMEFLFIYLFWKIHKFIVDSMQVYRFLYSD